MNSLNEKIGKYRWTICALLFFGTTINYLDRQVLSLLHPILEEEFNWSYSDYANITAFFQLAYAISMLFVGRIVDKLGTKTGFAIAIVVWSIGAMIHAYAVEIGTFASDFLGILGVTGLSVSVVGFIIARLVLGIGESANFPAAIKATAEYFPKKERSLATGIFNSGSNIGAILAPLTVPLIAYNYGWEATFLIIGSIGFIWLIFWLIFYEIPAKQKRLSKAELAYISSDSLYDLSSEIKVEKPQKVSWIKLLSYRQTWAYFFGKFLTDGVWWFFLFWLPSYLINQFNLTSQEITLPLAVLYSMTMVGSIAGGGFPMYFIKKGYNAYDGRMKAMFIIALFPLVVLLVQPLAHLSLWVPVILIGVGASAHQAWSANVYSTVSDMFPKFTVATITGIGGMGGGIGGALMSKFVGELFDYYKSINDPNTGYLIVFAICALAYLVAWCVMKLLVPKMKVIKFD